MSELAVYTAVYPSVARFLADWYASVPGAVDLTSISGSAWTG